MPKDTSVCSGTKPPDCTCWTIARAVAFTLRISLAQSAMFRALESSTPLLWAAMRGGIMPSIISSHCAPLSAFMSLFSASFTKESSALWQKVPSSSGLSLNSRRSAALKPYVTKWSKGQAL